MKRALPYLASVFLILWLSLTALFTVSLDDEIYDWMQRRSGVTEENCGLTASERMNMNRNVAVYLAGRSESIENLSARAQAHMADVRALFEIGRWAMYACFALACALGAISWRLKERFARIYFVCAGAFIALCLALGAVTALNFDGVFQAFHELVFTNDFWILDPAQDALIRILPEAFFGRMALAAGGLALIHISIAGAILVLSQKLTGRLSFS